MNKVKSDTCNERGIEWHVNMYLTRKHPGYKVQRGEREPLIHGVSQADGWDSGPETHDNTRKCHKYKNKNKVCFRDCEVRRSEGLGNTVAGQDARDEDKLEINGRE